MTKQIKTAKEIQRLAGIASSSILPDEVADTIPVPRKVGTSYAIQVLFYRETGRPGTRSVHSPHYYMLLHPETGEVIKFSPYAPAKFDVIASPSKVLSDDLPKKLTAEEYTERVDRLFAISQPLWMAFMNTNSRIDEESIALAKEYLTLFKETTKPEVAAFVRNASIEFFEWLESRAISESNLK